MSIKKKLIGRKIVAIEMNHFKTGRPERSTSYDPALIFDNGSTLRFRVVETEVGRYGIDLVFYPSTRK